MLNAIAGLARDTTGKRRLIYLGDMINRGPDSVRVLKLWARNEEAHGVDHVDRPMGNHEIMMMLAAIGGPHARKAETMWLSRRMGGHVLLDQMAAGAGHPTAHDGGALGLDQPWLPDWKGGFGRYPGGARPPPRPTSTVRSVASKTRTCSRATGSVSTVAAPAPAS